jgi:hypothetical protein
MSAAHSIDTSCNKITLFSVIRMPYKRHGVMEQARTEIREAMRNMTPAPDHILEGVYSSKIDGKYDVENVMFYNIGSSPFKRLVTSGIKARRCRLHDNSHSPGYTHRMDYNLIPTPNIPELFAVHLRFTPDRMDKAFYIWWAAGSGEAVKTGTVAGRYGMYVELSGPAVPAISAELLKRLFDGIIASLQREPSPNPAAVEKLSQNFYVEAYSIGERLKNPIISAIPPSDNRGLVQKDPSRVRWNPADDRCDECTLIVKHAATAICNVYVYSLDDRPSVIASP